MVFCSNKTFEDMIPLSRCHSPCVCLLASCGSILDCNFLGPMMMWPKRSQFSLALPSTKHYNLHFTDRSSFNYAVCAWVAQRVGNSLLLPFHQLKSKTGWSQWKCVATWWPFSGLHGKGWSRGCVERYPHHRVKHKKKTQGNISTMPFFFFFYCPENEIFFLWKSLVAAGKKYLCEVLCEVLLFSVKASGVLGKKCDQKKLDIFSLKNTLT